MKQTAVEWLVEKMLSQDWYTYKSLEYIEKAKEMEKQQIIDAVNFGDERGKITTYSTAEQYYNEKFGSHNSKNNSD